MASELVTRIITRIEHAVAKTNLSTREAFLRLDPQGDLAEAACGEIPSGSIGIIVIGTAYVQHLGVRLVGVRDELWTLHAITPPALRLADSFVEMPGIDAFGKILCLGGLHEPLGINQEAVTQAGALAGDEVDFATLVSQRGVRIGGAAVAILGR